MPVSMSPTSTDGLPPVMAWACGVWICRMSHCRGDRLSLSLAGKLGRSPGGGPEAPSSEPADGSSSRDAKPLVDDTPSTRLSLDSADANDALSERAMATP